MCAKRAAKNQPYPPTKCLYMARVSDVSTTNKKKTIHLYVEYYTYCMATAIEYLSK